jgi:hypothetical protein
MLALLLFRDTYSTNTFLDLRKKKYGARHKTTDLYSVTPKQLPRFSAIPFWPERRLLSPLI